MTDKLMTPAEWAALSAESRHNLNVMCLEYEKLKAANRWIPVLESLPAGRYLVSEQVEVLIDGKIPSRHFYYVPSEWEAQDWVYMPGWYAPGTGTPTDRIITHWRPLPEPPEVAK
jgi:hypothetical protein